MALAFDSTRTEPGRMGALIFSGITSLDGYVADADGVVFVRYRVVHTAENT